MSVPGREPEAISGGMAIPPVVIPAYAGIQEELGPGVRRDDENVPLGKETLKKCYIRDEARCSLWGRVTIERTAEVKDHQNRQTLGIIPDKYVRKTMECRCVL